MQSVFEGNNETAQTFTKSQGAFFVPVETAESHDIAKKIWADKPKRPRNANQPATFIVDATTGVETAYDKNTSRQREGGKKG